MRRRPQCSLQIDDFLARYLSGHLGNFRRVREWLAGQVSHWWQLTPARQSPPARCRPRKPAQIYKRTSNMRTARLLLISAPGPRKPREKIASAVVVEIGRGREVVIGKVS